MAASNRNIIINMRTTERDKFMFKQAAEYAGFSNLTNFIMTTIRKEANRILSENNVTYLNAEAWDKLQQILENPPEPNGALKELLNK